MKQIVLPLISLSPPLSFTFYVDRSKRTRFTFFEKWQDDISQWEHFSSNHIFPHWNPRSGRGPWLDLPAFLLCSPCGFTGQCHNSAGHQYGPDSLGAHVLLSGHPFNKWFGPFDILQYSVCWVSSEIIFFMRLILEIVCPRCFDPCFHWHEGWGPGGHGIWPLCGNLCSTPLHDHLDSLCVAGHEFVHFNLSSSAYTYFLWSISSTAYPFTRLM